MHFSKIETKELVIAGLLISLAFAILFAGGYKVLFSFDLSILALFIIAFLTAGIGFLLHEVMHKYVAQKYGYFAEFRAYYQGLFLGLLLSFFGFIIAAPGAVHIRNHGRSIPDDKNGKISVAGPLANVFLSVIFLIMLLIFNKAGLLGAFFSYGLSINSLLAAFNLLPVRPFDGISVLKWNKVVYAFAAISAGMLFVASWFL